MRADAHAQLLDEAALEWRILPEYWDIWRKKHVTPPQTKRAILRGFGVDSDSAEGIRRALDERRRREWQRPLQPALVVTDDDLKAPVRVPLHHASGTMSVRVRLEDGGERSHEVALGALPAADHTEIDGQGYVEKLVELPPGLPAGYHELQIHIAGAVQASTRLIVAPARAYQPEFLTQNGRAAGIAVALYGLRSSRNWGCGDLSDLYPLVDWAAGDLAVSFVALNPLHAIHNRRPYNTSPYLPNCIYYQNFLYLDVEAVEDFQHSRRARQAWGSDSVQAEVQALRNSEHVEYERVAALKLRLLKLAYASFLRELRKRSPRAQRFLEFTEAEGDLLERFATYCALDEHIHRSDPDAWIWPQWPEEYQDPESDATREFRRKRWRSVTFYKYLQWLLDGQLSAIHEYARQRLRIGLYHDLALATDRFGSDLWSHRRFFVPGCRVGSPPDDFSPTGQDWGFPPPQTDYHRENGYRLFAEGIRKNCRHGGALRIDHVMRFFRLYWIPDGIDATAGAYVRDRYEDLVRILTLESVRQKVLIVGEDLGTVEAAVQKALAKSGIFSYRLLYFEKHENGEFKLADEYPKQALVSSTTHDLPTLGGFWTGEDIRARRTAGTIDEAGEREQWTSREREKQRLLDLLFAEGLLPEHCPRNATRLPEWTGELHYAAIGFLSSTPSQLLAINQEDLTKEIHQQNLPGTTWQYPNWGRKMRFSVEELKGDSLARDFTAMFRGWLERTGRAQ
jgi:4-alpha-glucanotransferase